MCGQCLRTDASDKPNCVAMRRFGWPETSARSICSRLACAQVEHSIAISVILVLLVYRLHNFSIYSFSKFPATGGGQVTGVIAAVVVKPAQFCCKSILKEVERYIRTL